MHCWLKKMEEKNPDIRNWINFKWMHFRMKCYPNHSICMIQWLAIKYTRVLCVRVCFCMEMYTFRIAYLKIMENSASFAFFLVWEWDTRENTLWYIVTVILLRIYLQCLFFSFSLCYGNCLCSDIYFWWCYLVRDFHIILRIPCVWIIFCTTIYTRTKLYSSMYILYLRCLHNTI